MKKSDISRRTKEYCDNNPLAITKLKNQLKLVEGYFHPFDDSYVEIIPFIHNSSEKIITPDKVKLYFNKGTKIKFLVMIYDKVNRKLTCKPSIIEERIE